MAVTKKDFFRVKPVVLCDTREQKNEHIRTAFNGMGVEVENRKLDLGDYSFTIGGKDFSSSFAVERKANVDEIYSNIMDRGRIEKELQGASKQLSQFILLIENVGSWDELKAVRVPETEMEKEHISQRTGQIWKRQQRDIGYVTYCTLRAWSAGNRYNFPVEFIKDPKNTAVRMLELMYYYWRNYKELTAARR